MSEATVVFQSFIGVDLHKNTVTLAAVKPDGTLIDRVKIGAGAEAFLAE